LLKKTNYIAPHDYSSKYTPSHGYTLHIKDEKTENSVESLTSIYNDLKKSKVLSQSDFNLVNKSRFYVIIATLLNKSSIFLKELHRAKFCRAFKIKHELLRISVNSHLSRLQLLKK
jgi:hypothetical protein